MIGFIWFIIGLTVLAVCAPFILKFVKPHEMTWQEVGVSVVASVILSVASVLVVMFGGKFNTEILNGEVVKKAQVSVSCEHSYQVCSGSGDSRVCTTHYEHFNDYDWRVYTTVGELNISRVDRQGTREPPRFSQVQIGEYAAIENSYIDYLKDQESSLLYKKNRRVVPEFQRLVPAYPTVYDYYRNKPVLFKGVKISNKEKEQYNIAVTNMLKTLGNKKQVNVVVVIANTARPEFGEYLRNEWHNGRKNDQVVVIGVTEYPKVEWSYAFGWSKDLKVNSALSYDLNGLDELTPDLLVNTLQTNIQKHFKRRSMEEFKSYLWETKISWWAILLVVLVQIIVNVGIAFYMINNDTVSGYRRSHFRRRFR